MLAALWLTLAFFEAPLAAAVAAGGAVSIPIIIHLLNRRRFKVVQWAAMRFLLAAQKKNSRRMRLEQLILLLVRCLIVLVLLLAMVSVTGWAEALWRWLMPGAAVAMPATSTRTHKVLVLDGSFSMGARVGDSTVFEKAREKAAQVVRESNRGDAFSVVLLSAPPRRIVPEPSEDPVKVAAEINALRMPHGNSDLAAGLATVESLVQASPGKFPEKEVYFFTDLQKSTWITGQPLNQSGALKRARTAIVDVGGEDRANLAVTGLSLLDDVAVTSRSTVILATVRNFSNEPRENLPVKLLVGQARGAAGDAAFELRQVHERTVRVDRNQEATVAFDFRFTKPGDYVIQVQIQGDVLPLDDVRSAVITVKKELPVLLVNGKSFGDEFDQSAVWLKFALNPFTGRDEGLSVVRPKMINAPQFSDETQGDLSGYDCVFLCDLPSVSLAEARRLEGHLRRGGGVVFCLGGQVQAGEYNRVLYRDGAQLLPAPLVGIQAAGPAHQYQFALENDSERTPPMRAFRGENDRMTLLAPRFARFFQTGPPVTGVKPRRVLSFATAVTPGKEREARTAQAPPGGPAILEWHPPAAQEQGAGAARPAAPTGPQPSSRLRGRVVLVTAPVNSDWGNWPASPSYPALMHELLYFASSGRLHEQAIEVGQALELFLPAASGADTTIMTPDGREERGRTVPLDDGSVLRWADNDVSGVYRVTVGQHPREHLFAVNVPALTSARLGSESDLAKTTRDDLQKAYPEWEQQIVKDLAQVDHTPRADSAPPEKVYQPLGTGVARWLLYAVLLLVLAEIVLAYVFGHYTSAAGLEEEAKPRARTWAVRLLSATPWVLLAFGLGLAAVLVHETRTSDFLGFLSDGTRGWVESLAGIAAPAAGEGSRWRLEYTPYFLDARSDPWLVGALLIGAGALVWVLYRREGKNPNMAQRIVLMGLRLGILLLLLAVLMPQLKLYFERQSWPDVVLLIDDSQSMSATERYGEADVREAADVLARESARMSREKRNLAGKLEEQAAQLDELAQKRTHDDPEHTKLIQQAKLLREQAAGLTQEADNLGRARNGADLQRLHLLQALATRRDLSWLTHLVEQRKVKVHVYHCSSRAARLANVTSVDELPKAADAIQGMVASPRNDSSQLGGAVRQVINDFRGSSLAAVVMLTDGVTTEGEDLVKASKYAAQAGVSLFFVGVGAAHDVRDIYLHDLQGPDSVYVNDRIVFELNLTGKGYKNLTVPVILREKGKTKELDRKMVQIDPGGKPVKVRLNHKPTEPDNRVYEVETPVQEDEVEKDNNRLEKAISVRETKLVKVLLVEGQRRYEFHYLKTLLERESNRVKANKTFELKVLLLSADPGFARADKSALNDFPTKKELEAYDVVILGDADPQAPKMDEFLKNLADFVKEKGRGLLMIAGERYAPHAYRNSPLRDVLPIDMPAERRDDPDFPRVEGFHPELTPAGRVHPSFRFDQNEKENDEIWGRLRELYWWADGYQAKRAAEVLMVHPREKRGGKEGEGVAPEGHPLIVQHFVGSGRCMFFGINETWRWGWREDLGRYNNFWIQTVRNLGSSRLDRIDLHLDRQTGYRRGEPIKVTVRFPDDKPNENSEVKVIAERKAPGKAGDREVRTLNLVRLESSRATYETVLTQTPEGEYKFWLSVPAVPDPKPQAECKVTAPPGEMYGLRMNQSDMEAAAEETRGKFYNLATADQLLQDLEVGQRVTLNSSGPPVSIWNHAGFFVVALLFLATEWLLRKQQNLL